MNDMSPPVLSITHLNVYYGKALALRDINMSILANQAGCTGLWNDAQAEAFAPIVASV